METVGASKTYQYDQSSCLIELVPSVRTEHQDQES
jgi:hypothetical protein